MTNTGDDELVRVRLAWAAVDEMPIIVANQAAIGFTREGEFILTVGQVAPPVFTGTEEEKTDAARALDEVPIRPIARFGLSRTAVAEFAEVLRANLARHDAIFGVSDDA